MSDERSKLLNENLSLINKTFQNGYEQGWHAAYTQGCVRGWLWGVIFSVFVSIVFKWVFGA